MTLQLHGLLREPFHALSRSTITSVLLGRLRIADCAAIEDASFLRNSLAPLIRNE